MARIVTMYGHEFTTRRVKYSGGRLGGWDFYHIASRAAVVQDFKPMREAVRRGVAMLESWGEELTLIKIANAQQHADADRWSMAAAYDAVARGGAE